MQGASRVQARHWLTGVLDSAATKGWCVQHGCSTCGSVEFRWTLKRRLAQNDPARLPRQPQADLKALYRLRNQRVEFNADECSRLMNQLYQLAEPGALSCDRTSYPDPLTVWQEAIVSIERECRSVLGHDEADSITSAYSGTYAHEIMERDRGRRIERATRRQENLFANSPDRAAESLDARQREHNNRLARKRERDKELTDLGAVRYGTHCSRPELFRKLHTDGLLGGFWN